MPKRVAQMNHREWGWIGTKDDLADLLDRVEAVIAQVEQDVDRRPALTLRSGQDTLRFEDPTDFRSWTDWSELARADSITIFRGGLDLTVILILVRVRSDLGPGSHLQVSGENAVAVSGIGDQLRRELRKRRRLAPPAPVIMKGLVTVMGVELVGYVAISTAFTINRSLNDGIFIGIIGWTIVGLVAAAFAYFVTPAVEVLDPADPRTRFNRWGRWLAGALVTLALTTLAGVIANAVT